MLPSFLCLEAGGSIGINNYVCLTSSSQCFSFLDSEEGCIPRGTVLCGDSEDRFCTQTWIQILAALFMSLSKSILFSGPCLSVK